MATNKKREILVRAYLGFAFIFLLGMAIIGRAFYIQTAEGNYYRSLADSLTIFPKTVFAERGNIYSADGRLLATTLPTFDIRIDFKTTLAHPEIFKQNIDSVALLLGQMFPEKNAAQYKTELIRERKKKNRYYLLKRNVSFNQLNEVKHWPLFREGQYKSGMIVLQEDKRLNPFLQLAKRTLGSINDEGGIAGLEKQFDSELKGKEGTIMVQKIAGGVTVPLDSKEEMAAQPGKDIYTTLDIELQDVAQDALMRSLQHHAADHGCVILMEVKTGRIKAMANLGLIKDSTYGEIQNYAVGEATEPGSTFKLATVASLIEDGIVTKDSKVFVGDGKYTVYNKTIADHDAPESPEITLQRAFEESSNVAMASLADKNYAAFKEKYYKHLVDFGFDKRITIELPGAAKPVLREPKKWSGVSAAYLAHGYELAITPLHTLTFYNAIANNGVMVKPYIVEKIKSYNTTIDSTKTEIMNPQVCSEKTIAQLRKMLEGVVENGTAANLKTDYLHVAGKTGTAVVSQGKTGYKASGKKIYRASFCGYFPAENPQYSMIVMINSPSANGYYGNVVAGSIFKEVADKVYSLNLNMHKSVNEVLASHNSLPVISTGTASDLKNIYDFLGTGANSVDGEWAIARPNGNSVLLAQNEINGGTIPDVTGMSLKDALYLLESMGLNVKVNGKGTVISQSLVGEKISKGTQITIELR